MSAQEVLRYNATAHVYEATQVLAADSIKADILYSRAMEWVALNYKSAKDVVQYSNADAKKIIIKGNFPIFIFLKDGWIGHTLTLEFKDGRYKYCYNNLTYISPGTGEMAFESNMLSKKKLLDKTNDKIVASIENIDAYLKAAPKKDNW